MIWVKDDSMAQGLLSWCRACERPVLAQPSNWEPDKLAFLCLERVYQQGPYSADQFVSQCQGTLTIIDDQDAADTAYIMGGWEAIKAMALEQILRAG